MEPWSLEVTDLYERRYANYEKKNPDELTAVLSNLDTYFKTLNHLGHPLQVKAGFIHSEPMGIKAIDQKGGGQRVKLEQTRLYIYPNTETKTVYLLTIGNKNSQKEDIRSCCEYINKQIRNIR